MSTTDFKDIPVVQPPVAAENVWIMDDSFYMPQLNSNRRIWIYLPEDYHTSGRDYPVLYMQDGQNLFEEWSAFGEEWGVDESLNKLHAECIVVGIDNAGSRRLNEYTIEDHPRYGKSDGLQYLEFVAETLKTYIDKSFRTKPGREHTFLAGSSMGALISFYGCLLYPNVFGGGGVFSPAFWIAPHLHDEIKRRLSNSSLEQRFYFYYGGKECDEMELMAEPVLSLLREYPNITVTKSVNEEGTHSEAEWREQFPDFYNWLMNQKSEDLVKPSPVRKQKK